MKIGCFINVGWTGKPVELLWGGSETTPCKWRWRGGSHPSLHQGFHPRTQGQGVCQVFLSFCNHKAMDFPNHLESTVFTSIYFFFGTRFLFSLTKTAYIKVDDRDICVCYVTLHAWNRKLNYWSSSESIQ